LNKASTKRNNNVNTYEVTVVVDHRLKRRVTLLLAVKTIGMVISMPFPPS
jgi:hypothetical protein